MAHQSKFTLALLLIASALFIHLALSGPNAEARPGLCQGHLCEFNNGCGGKTLSDTDTGRPVGCNAACVGDCYRCINSANTDYCLYTGNPDDICTAVIGKLVVCGVKEQNAGACSAAGGGACNPCPAGGVPTTDACKLQKCQA